MTRIAEFIHIMILRSSGLDPFLKLIVARNVQDLTDCPHLL
jgi:hypothetical protein